ncbi:adhesion G-protein coupled receptor G7 isoform X2 [Cavia porcellus]|uniref:adhesion G-protein coupled receptor G7 isoform X2 n=1 Tax=Cavia porcellus TaxID=10141 RepID=UPI002FE211F8
MAVCSTCNIRVLVVIVCGLLTVIISGLTIWRTVVKIRGGKNDATSDTSVEFCKNGGTWANGRCTCTEEWKGLRCTIANFCENSTYKNFTFNRIPVGRYGPSLETCDKNTLNAGNPIAIRLCNLSLYGEMQLENATIGNCNQNLATLEQQIDNIAIDSKNISTEAQILTSDASKLTPENIISATNVVGQIFNESRNADAEAKKTAVTTLSQLLDASENVFQTAAATNNSDTFAMLIEQIENYSLTLGNELIEEPNVAIRSVNLTSTSVRFSVEKRDSDGLVSYSTHEEANVDGLNPHKETELQILVNTNTNNNACGFVVYQNNKLFQSKTFISRSDFSQKIISAKVKDQSASVKMVFSPKYNQREFQFNSYACVYWNFVKKDWDTYGCFKDQTIENFLGCHCNHTTNFAVLMTFKKNCKYAEPLDVLSLIGCALSIAGLALTIIFQIFTRKVRKTSVTWVLVSLCASMLIFNLLFVFGIENSNKNLKANDRSTNTDSDNNQMPTDGIVCILNPACTAIAALLHYFLLATFMWHGLSALQIYFLLIRTMKAFPQHFILFVTVVGWGVLLIIVGVTMLTVHFQSYSCWELQYRQEEICWLAISNDNNFMTNSFLWSFMIPITIILIGNIVTFGIIVVKVLWKNNPNLTSTKRISTLRKIIGTLSMAVVLGITWILAYFMLISNDNIRNVFSILFCIFNTTQGLQIFIFYTVRTKIFQSEASKILKSLFSSIGKMKLQPPLSPRIHLRMYNLIRSLPSIRERFMFLEPSVETEEMILTESDKEN